MAVNHIPDGYHSITPYMILSGAAAAIEFYKEAFGATELMRMAAPNGKIGHAEMQIGDSRFMLADEHPEMNMRSPKTVGGSPMFLHIYVKDVDAQVSKAVAAGAKPVRAVEDQFYGDRSGSVEDPFGYTWHLATHTEDLSEEEMGKRAAAAMKG